METADFFLGKRKICGGEGLNSKMKYDSESDASQHKLRRFDFFPGLPDQADSSWILSQNLALDCFQCLVQVIAIFPAKIS